MRFTSVAFLFYFLPIFLLIFRIASPTGKLTILARLVIIAGTYAFYGFENLGYLIPFLFSTLMDLVWSSLLGRAGAPWMRKLIVACSVVQNLSIFFVFKYLNWVAALFPQVAMLQSLHALFADSDGSIALPPGVSFYLFESLSFVIDCYRGTVAQRRAWDFLLFLSMFPRFIAGPIVRYSQIDSGIKNYQGPRVADGIFLFCIGFILKILFADSFAQLVDPLFAQSTGLDVSWGVALSYSFQLYLDFSGYSLMAIGLGLALGFSFPDNFREPYHASSISHFWRRWHISLSTWLRDYVYIPLGGSRRGQWRTHLSIFFTMLLGGLWHGAASTFLLWGGYHGALVVLDKILFSKFSFLQTKAFCFFLVAMGWILFRARNLEDAAEVYAGLVGLNGWGGNFLDKIRFGLGLSTLCLLGIVWIFLAEPRVRAHLKQEEWHTLRLESVPAPAVGGVLVLFLLSVRLALSAESMPFLYFRF